MPKLLPTPKDLQEKIDELRIATSRFVAEGKDLVRDIRTLAGAEGSDEASAVRDSINSLDV